MGTAFDLVPPAIEIFGYIDYFAIQDSFVYNLCPCVRMNRTAPDPILIHPSTYTPNHLEVTFGSKIVIQAVRDKHNIVRQDYAHHSNLNGQHRG